MELNLKNTIEELIYEVQGFELISQAIFNVKTGRGEIYQVKLIVTRDEDDISSSTSLPDMKIQDGLLVEDFD